MGVRTLSIASRLRAVTTACRAHTVLYVVHGTSASYLRASPVYHRTRDSIGAHLTIVPAALAVSRWTENVTGWSKRNFIKTARRCT